MPFFYPLIPGIRYLAGTNKTSLYKIRSGLVLLICDLILQAHFCLPMHFIHVSIKMFSVYVFNHVAFVYAIKHFMLVHDPWF